MDSSYLLPLLRSVVPQVFYVGFFELFLSNLVEDAPLCFQVLCPEGSGPSSVYMVFIFSSSEIGPLSLEGSAAGNLVSSGTSLLLPIVVGSST